MENAGHIMPPPPPPVEEEGASQLDILIQLYEGCIHFLEEASQACDQGQVAEFKHWMQRGRRIIEEFQNTLDFTQGGQVPAQLNDLYQYMLDSLTQAGLTHDSLFIQRVIEQLRVLLEGWQGVRSSGFSSTLDH
ncbi:MAG: flagellar export chaperone FliS [Magnetococcales bacterium]|nr:flagellar export chaperone FliS [Magnetococcales bacterium]